MTPGTKPIPSALKLVHGNPGHRPINPNEFKPLSGAPKCPRHVTGEARREWIRLVKEFAAVGLLTGVDRGMLAMMCTAWGDHVKARDMMAKAEQQGGSGMFVKSPNNYPMQSPWMAVSNKSLELYCRLAVEFGMSPSSRTRVQNAPVMPATAQAVTRESGWKQFN